MLRSDPDRGWLVVLGSRIVDSLLSACPHQSAIVFLPHKAVVTAKCWHPQVSTLQRLWSLSEVHRGWSYYRLLLPDTSERDAFVLSLMTVHGKRREQEQQVGERTNS